MSKRSSDGRDDSVKTYKFERHKRAVGNPGCCVEVIHGIEVDRGLVDRSAPKHLEAGHLDGLLESNGIASRDALDVNTSLTKDGHSEGLVGEQPCVEGGQGIHILDLEGLGNLDLLKGLAGGLGEVDAGERNVRRDILEVHDPEEGLNGGVNLAITLDGAVDRHGHLLGLGIGDSDAVDNELGVIKLGLSNLGNGDQETG